ncbi:hypothetical protein L6R53_02720 [Myxococcota bacterium]|nr:hypothetical protein [Myxococcota bacterium]
MPSPNALRSLALACRDAGGRAWLVGGSVRDTLLGLPCKDLDVEVHGLPAPTLLRLLRRLGRVNEVGRSFGVYKLSVAGGTLDVSLPRRDSNAGPGHRGIQVEGDPHMGVVEAARRRDLTINAMLQDPITGEVLDPFGGRADLAAGRLRAVDPATFLDDPLRALRVVQFAGRFGFDPDEELVELCRRAPLAELPAERVMGEVEKLLLRSARPSRGLAVARRAAVLARILPEVDACPAGAVDAAVDRAAAQRDQAGAEPRPLALMLGALLHRVPVPQVDPCLDRLRVHRSLRFPLRDRVRGAVAAWPSLVGTPSDTHLRELAETEEVGLVCRVAHAASGSPAPLAALERARRLGIEDRPLPRLVQGRDLHPLGIEPGPEMGALLELVRRAQLDGRVGTAQEAVALVAHQLADPSPSSEEPP